MSDFRCPVCGGPYFGRNWETGVTTCHGDGSDKPYRKCWKGIWPMCSTPTVILATGLGQGKISNGMNRARKHILAACPEADVRVVSYKQHEEIPDLARELIQSGAEIIGGAHSFGAWWWTLLAKELGDYPVRCLCFADGVGRHPLHSPLVVRPNVQEFHSWRQTRGIIKGSPIAVVRLEETNWVTNEVVNVLHPFVDEVQGFQEALVTAVVAAYLST